MAVKNSARCFNIPVVHTRRLVRFRPKQLINRVQMTLLPLEKILCVRYGRHPRRGPHGPSRGGGGGVGCGGGASYGSFRFRHHPIACVLCVHPSINAIFWGVSLSIKKFYFLIFQYFHENSGDFAEINLCPLKMSNFRNDHYIPDIVKIYAFRSLKIPYDIWSATCYSKCMLLSYLSIFSLSPISKKILVMLTYVVLDL